MLDTENKITLLKIARKSLVSHFGKGKMPFSSNETFPESLRTPSGAFVSLYKKGSLRGCIGRFQSSKPLCEVVRDMTISAATRDFRFKPVDPSEIDEINIEISVLTPMVRIQDASDIVLGKHGIYIKKGSNSGTFLPQVARETGWNLDEFLGHCSRDKAGIGWYGWKEAELFIYEAIVFKETDDQQS